MANSGFKSFVRQTAALTKKNLVIAVVRRPISTCFRALILPIAYLVLILEIQNLLTDNSKFGVGRPSPVQTLNTGLLGSKPLVIVVPPGLGSDVNDTVRQIVKPLADVPQQLIYLDNVTDLLTTCRVNIHGNSNCYAAIVFNDSPQTSGGSKTWSYTLRGDPSDSGYPFNVHRKTNVEDTKWLPLQAAVENAITNSTVVPDAYMFTQSTQEERDKQARQQYQELVITIYCIALFIATLSAIYHVVSMVTTERESGIAALIDTMGGTAAARVFSYVIAFDLIYLPCWFVSGFLYWKLLFPTSSAAISLFWYIFNGWALTSASVFAAAFFWKSQLSGIYAVVGFLVVALGAMLMDSQHNPSSGAVAALSLLFPSMNFIFTLGYYCRFEMQGLSVNLAKAPPGGPPIPISSSVPTVALWIFLVIQIFVYPILAILVEWLYHGISFAGREFDASPAATDSSIALRTSGLGKTYKASRYKRWLGNSSSDVVALQELELVSHRQQILCLLGANGSGKTTTLDLIAGKQKLTHGTVHINAESSQLGVCPQQNVLFDELTVAEHVQLWSQIKGGGEDTPALERLIEACDLTVKTSSRAGSLSGGQKRKLQLACMFVGGSSMCLMDEVTSGLDPLSRRLIWNIILVERSKRSMIFTTHFLDECEVLADHILIISKGSLKCQGPSAALKNQFGKGYRVHIPYTETPPSVDGYTFSVHQDRTIYSTPDSKSAATLASRLDDAGETDVVVAGPTVEDVFLNVADEHVSNPDGEGLGASTSWEPKDYRDPGHQLSAGHTPSFPRQVLVLMRKRLTILTRVWWPYFFALAIPVAVTPALNRFLTFYHSPSCVPVTADVYNPVPFRLQFNYRHLDNLNTATRLAAGPASSNSSVYRVASSFPIGKGYDISNYNTQFFLENTFQNFQQYISTNFANITPGAIWMGDSSSSPTYAYASDLGIYTAMTTQNLYTQVQSGVQIDGAYQFLSSLISPTAGNSLTYVAFFCLIQVMYPALFCIYPTYERLRRVRALQYSNGVRPLPLWVAYLLFDLVFVVITSIAVTLATWNEMPYWYAVGYLFPVLILYGLAAILMGYIISMLAKSQLAAFGFTAGTMGAMFALTIVIFSIEEAFTGASNLEQTMDATTFSLNLIFPIGNVFRAVVIGLNVFLVACRNDKFPPYPGSIFTYGGPILYLCIQVAGLFAILMYLDKGVLPNLPRSVVTRDSEEAPTPTRPDIDQEARRVEETESDLLRILHLSRSFGDNLAVDNVSLGLGKGEILALLGPNGAGKTTIVNIVRGELRPDSGVIRIRGTDIKGEIRAAQQHLGVCPQFDALDLMTAREHLEFYARVRGITNVRSDVDTVLAMVGLTSYESFLAAKLSGGNKRKLSLAISLLGNPGILLLDEPSSSMDAVAKRNMWQTLARIAPGRSILLTTHSMEEADALATRAAIISKRLLAIGTTQELRHRYSAVYHVQLVLRTAPTSSAEEMDRVERWAKEEFPDSTSESQSLGGQVRFVVPAMPQTAGQQELDATDVISSAEAPVTASRQKGSIVTLIQKLEAQKEDLGVEYYSVGAPTLERVFMSVVKENKVLEEDETERRRRWKWPCFRA